MLKTEEPRVIEKNLLRPQSRNLKKKFENHCSKVFVRTQANC